MRVIFLDFDGVLNSAEFHVRRDLAREEDDRTVDWWTALALDPRAVAVLNEIVERSGAKVVVSSTWRRMCDLKELRRLLGEVGFEGELIDETPHYLGMGTCRGDEIRDWLQHHPEVQEFVILDDDDDMYGVAEHLVRTNTTFGLLREHLEPALKILRA